MYDIYSEVIEAAERALESFDETKELLEYPEVQADKAYYLSVLEKYNDLKFLADKLSVLKSAFEEKKEYSRMLAEGLSDTERSAVREELFSLNKTLSEAAAALAEALGCRHVKERVYCRFKLKANSYKFGVGLYSLIKAEICRRGGKIEDEDITCSDGGVVREISFVAEGEDARLILFPLTGAHKAYLSGGRSEEICFAATDAERREEIDEKDFKIDYFHSSGAGGQNVNKVETAVRVTHIPTGVSVVCQDERSQLKNKRRALETIKKRLKESGEREEKKRIEADICAGYLKKSTPISFDGTANTMTDTRLKGFAKIPFPLIEEQFAIYINGLISL